MKKLIAIALAGVLALSMAACGAQSTETTATTAAATTAAAETTEAAKLSGTVTLAGSTSMQKLCEAMIESFEESYPNITVTAEYTGSGAGLESLVGGKTDIGNASRALKDGEKESGAVENIVAIDGIAVITHTSNTVSNLTSQQLTDIYTGKITNWKDLGGADEAIVVLGREAGSGTRDGFESIVDVKDSCKYAQELTATGAVISAVEANPLAIGYASLSAVGDTVAMVTVEGVECSEDTVKDGSYKIQRPFVFVTNKSVTLSEQAQAFVEFANSKDAADLIRTAGAVPVNE